MDNKYFSFAEYGRALIEVARAIMKDITLVEIFSHVAERIVLTLGAERCTIYRIFTNENKEKWCEIVAGLPANEHGIGDKEILAKHPDIKSAVEARQAMIIYRPGEDERTLHFQKIVFFKRINQILYVPVFYSQEVVGIIVVDANGERKGFAPEDAICCQQIAELLSIILDRDHNVHEEIRHEVVNSTLMVAGCDRVAKKALEANDVPKALEFMTMAEEGARKLNAAIPRVIFQN